MSKTLWYVGDPCYVVSHEHWDKFCNELWSKKGEYGLMDWTALDGFKGKVDVYSSPGGDGCWRFGSGSLGVDAGLLCIMPVELTDYSADTCRKMGIVFDFKPTLEVSDSDYWVCLNSEYSDGSGECGYCNSVGQLEMCDECCYESCYSCFDCECDEDD